MDNKDLGRSAEADGLSPSVEPVSVSPAAAASIPSADLRGSVVSADNEIGLYGGYWLSHPDLGAIGRIERYYPIWERRTKGRMWVNARGKCKRAEYRTYLGAGWGTAPTFRTLSGAVRHLFASAIEARSGETEGLDPKDESATAESRDAQSQSPASNGGGDA